MTRYEFLWTVVIAPIAALFGISTNEEEMEPPSNWIVSTDSTAVTIEGNLRLVSDSGVGKLYIDTTNGDDLQFTNTMST